MESRYVKLDYNEALSAKKELLSSEINLLNIARKMENFRQLRKKELLLKTRLKFLLNNLKSKINLFQSTFPQEQGKVNIRKPAAKESKKSRHIQDELEDIRNKLARLQ